MAFVRGIHRWPVNSPHKGPVTRKIFPFDDVIMNGRHSHINHTYIFNIIMHEQAYWYNISEKSAQEYKASITSLNNSKNDFFFIRVIKKKYMLYVFDKIFVWSTFDMIRYWIHISSTLSNAKSMPTGPLETNLRELWIKIHGSSFKKKHFKCILQNGDHLFKPHHVNPSWATRNIADKSSQRCIMTWISNYIHEKQWNVIIHPYPNFNGGLVNPSLKLSMGW